MKTKKCSTCTITKPVTEFNKKSSTPDGYERYCKECHRERNRLHYAANKKAYKQSAKKFKQLLREWYVGIKQQHVCLSCGEDKYWRLAFHHRDPTTKVADVSQMVIGNISRAKILEEIEKCDALCHNCHSDVHHLENNDTGFA